MEMASRFLISIRAAAERKRGMSISAPELARRLAYTIAVLASIPFGLLTIALFFATGRVVPESFVSWSELGCNALVETTENGVVVEFGPRFVGLTDCGRAYIVKSLCDATKGPSSPCKTTLYDVFTNEKLGDTEADDRFQQSVLSRDRKHLLMDIREDGLVLRDLISGRDLAKTEHPDNYQQIALIKSGNLALIRSDLGGLIWDMETGKQISSFHLPRKKRSFGYCDGAGHTKCLTVGERVEIWNEDLDSREFVLDVTPSSADAFQFSPDFRRLSFVANGAVSVMSLETGQLIRRIPFANHLGTSVIQTRTALKLCEARVVFSNRARWLTEEYYRWDPLIDWAYDIDSRLGDSLSLWLPVKNLAMLIDLESNRTWRDMPAGKGVAFSEDDSRLVTFGEDGKYEWTVPPRRQYFTPWAWAALAAWLGAITIWWKLRKRPSRGNRQNSTSS